MEMKNELLLAFYGDDLTGSTDSLEALEMGGIPSVLFLEPPTSELLTRFQDVQAVGLAGVSRTMTPDEMGQALPNAFASLKNLGAPLTHYKVCSTFDSSPEIGSIGRATEIGKRVFETPLVPVMVGAPKLKRFVVFGNHFASVGDTTFRLDRHPTMSKHPITPMDESDLRLHLGKQTTLSMGLVDVRHLAEADQAIQDRLERIQADGLDIVIFDTLDEEHQLKVGQLIWQMGQRERTFVVGSSGVEFALAAYMQSTGKIAPPEDFDSPGPVDQIVAISGSASPVAAAQMQHAFEHGFEGVRLDSVALVDPQKADAAREQAKHQARAALQNGRSVTLYSALGPDDPHIQKTRQHLDKLGIPQREISEVLGKQQGLILKEILLETDLRRCAVAGGDTSGNALKQLGVFVLKFLMPLGAATPLCRAGSHDPQFDGLEVSLKGGQLGEIDFFERVLQARF